MKKSIFTFIILALGIVMASCQENKNNDSAKAYAFNDEHWQIENTDGSSDSITIVPYQGRQSLALNPGQKAYLKSGTFKNFILEFYCNGQTPGLGFRVHDKKNYDYLYLRTFMSGKRDAIQYLPIHNGSLPWQLYNYPLYEGNATYPRREVATLPLSMEKELVGGKASDDLLTALKKAGVLFSEESFVDVPDGSPAYIYDPQSANALIFEKGGEGFAFLDVRTWIRIKVAVMEEKMSVYVDDMETPSFVVENLKRDPQAGGISLYSDFGNVYYSNFSITETKVQNTISPENNGKHISPNYLTEWRMSEMFIKDSVNFGQQVDSILKQRERFKTVEADMDGLINISRFYDDMDKTVVLTSRIVADASKEVILNFDYADHLVIFLNSEILFDEGMSFRPPPEKGTEGRVFVDDEQVTLKLSKGTNDLVFLLSGDNRQKFNWGYIAKLEDLSGISLK